ncbi:MULTISPECIES: DLW-39 family protein [Aestuariimicrobium]|nr:MULTISPECIES: DLW-39 family protein [Aestuariimicrobium]CAI9403275.1 hypothetical protein AESSP_00972 [Aestuariimicrobium sp. T2.26MG-19.2B]
MNKPLLLVGVLAAVIAFLAAKRRVRDAENEAALWAEATDPLD